MNRYALVDWDNTLRPGFLLREWTSFLQEREPELRQRFQSLSIVFQLFIRNELSYDEFAEQAPLAYARGMAAANIDVIKSLAVDFVRRDATQSLYPFAIPLLALLARRKIHSIVISGAPAELLALYKSLVPVHAVFGLVLGTQDGIYTGTLEENTASAPGKAHIVERLSNDDIVVGIGDSPADLPLLRPARIRVLVGDNGMELDGAQNAIRLSPTNEAFEETLRRLDAALEKATAG